jgi:hypothetical protein
MKRIYLAGPIGPAQGREERIAEAIGWAERLRKLGLAVFVPHCFAGWYQSFDLTYDECMALDAVWLRQCEALFRMPGRSPGADKEVLLARELGLPVFTDVEALRHWMSGAPAAPLAGQIFVDGRACRIKFEFISHGRRAFVVEAPHGPVLRVLADGSRV